MHPRRPTPAPSVPSAPSPCWPVGSPTNARSRCGPAGAWRPRCAPSALAVHEWDADAGLLERLRTDRPDAVVIALHGGEGENGSVQAVLELLGVPFVGTPATACRRAWDKPTAKAELARAGLDTPDWVALPHATFRELGARAVLDAMVERLGLPLMLKPDQGGSALGAQVVTRRRGPAGRDGELPRLRRHGAGRAVHRRHRGRGVGRGRRAGAAGAPARRGRGEGRRLRLHRPLHAGSDRPSTARPGSTTRCWRRCERPRSPRTDCSACATSPGWTRWSTPPAGCRSWRSTCPRADRHVAAANGGGR